MRVLKEGVIMSTETQARERYAELLYSTSPETTREFMELRTALNLRERARYLKSQKEEYISGYTLGTMHRAAHLLEKRWVG